MTPSERFLIKTAHLKVLYLQGEGTNYQNQQKALRRKKRFFHNDKGEHTQTTTEKF